MNQIFGFMRQFEGMLLADKKDRTNRAKSDYRLKCDVGDYMYIYMGVRTKNAKKLFDAKVLKRIIWNINDAPETQIEAKRTESPLRNETWYQFAINDGFYKYEEFLEFFQDHPKKTSEFICYVFKRIDLDEEYKSRITDFLGNKESDLWEHNERCPQCGTLLENHDIKACETGMSYCSNECAEIHVKENYKEGGEDIVEAKNIEIDKQHIDKILERFKKHLPHVELTDAMISGFINQVIKDYFIGLEKKDRELDVSRKLSKEGEEN